MTSLERSLSCTSSTALSMSPRPSAREISPPGSELSLIYLHDRVNQLDTRVLELRSNLMTKDNYVDRRNREDELIRREFAQQNAISNRIDLNVIALRTDVDQIRSSILHLKTTVGQVSMETTYTRSDVDRLQKSVDQLQSDTAQIRSDSCAARIDIGKLQTATNQLRSEFSNLSRMFKSFDTRMDVVESLHANIKPVPVVLPDGSLELPEYFPRTIWRFWCLKKRSRVHRLVELCEFYQLRGYEDWRQIQSAAEMFAHESDSSDSSDSGYPITLNSAVHQYPEAALQALAATLGLVYSKIRKECLKMESGEGLQAAPRPPKRQQEDVASAGTSTKSKPVKMPRRPSVSDSFMQRLTSGVEQPYAETESSASGPSQILGWKAFSDVVSENAKGKLPSIDPKDLGAVLRALEQGRLKLKPSRSERMNMSPTQSKTSSNAYRKAGEPAQEEVPTEPHTVPNTIPHPVPTSAPNTVPTEVATTSSQGSRARQASIDPSTVSDSESSSMS
ncbi:uncharacterized protein N7484_009658 [Penicillium longicatenatum]|uniref:uncharacterized protein n=1 Tax=Penicillium longicatenatum TaxID=1561947 RepID=UPI00254881D9|nr:uncharacterized protein N7484_009658 [Penicillium longicatenatum]KAJ5636345.1 hypothetical protein N7484_009658 [Penicillium longicatenatum]